MNHISWQSLPAEDLSPNIRRRYLSYPGMTLAWFELKPGAVVPMHHHHNAQVTNLIAGALEFHFQDGSRKLVRPGESLYLEPNEPHEVLVTEAAVVLDLFMPEREDWAAKDDAYLRTTGRS